MPEAETKPHAETCRQQAKVAVAIAEESDVREYREACLRLATEWLRLAELLDANEPVALSAAS